MDVPTEDLAGQPTAAADPDAPVRLSLQEAIRVAQQLQRTEQLEAAEGVYQQILAVLPDQPDSLHFLGVLRFQQRRHEEALALIRRAAELLPGDAGPLLNLGNVLLEMSRPDEALAAYRQVVELQPDHLLAINNLGMLYTRFQRWEAAHHWMDRAMALAPESPMVNEAYGRLVYVQGRLAESCAYQIKALDLDPNRPGVRKMLIITWAILGDRPKALAVLNDWLQADPGNPEALHHLAALGGAAVPDRAADDYVAQLFDDFSDSFDATLARLDYQAPQQVSAALQAHWPQAGFAGADGATVLDAGCGTGLCGPLLRPMAGQLHGVDLSAGMLKRARPRAVYDELHHAELTAYLRGSPGRYHAIVSADTLCYFGDLGPVLQAAAAALQPQGLLVFSLESLADAAGSFGLQVHGRYAHALAYVQQQIASAGLVLLSAQPVVLRQEMMEVVNGWVVTARQPSGVVG